MSLIATARRSRFRRAIAGLAGGAILAGGALVALSEDTIASFADDVWVQAEGFTAAMFGFGIEGSLDNVAFGNHMTVGSAMELRGSTNPGTVQFTTPISLFPGRTSYASVYLRTKDSSTAATVSMSPAAQQPSPNSHAALWNTYVTYSVRAISDSTTCNAAVFSENQGSLIRSSAALGSTATSSPFTLPANGANATQLCFAFTLANSVTSGAANANGQSVHPYWTFTGRLPS